MANSGVKRRQRTRRLSILVLLLGVVVLLAGGYWGLAGLVVLLAYLANELLLADHIFYARRSDYQYRMGGTPLAHSWQGDTLKLDTDSPAPGDTLLLEVSVRATLAGYWFDPRVWIDVEGERCCQYFERGVGGRRYLNLGGAGPALQQGKVVSLHGQHCRLDSAQSRLWGFDNGDLLADGLLVLAPHADDAEIAAFGLYSRAETATVVTVTAGETEVEQFRAWTGSDQEASRFKGEVRCHDSVAAAIWGGLAQNDCVNLGYGCLQLQGMQAQPGRPVTSPYSGLADTRPFRCFNTETLPSDADGATTWHNLVADLAALLEQRRPAVLVAPHPRLDTHTDHRYATLALSEAVAASGIPAPRWLLYANHLDASQDFPFGPAQGGYGLPPVVGEAVDVPGAFNLQLDAVTRRRKALALDLMHDLKRPLKWKKWWRKRLQRLFLGRPITPYGEDDFFRKAVRCQELFVVMDDRQMAQLLEGLS